MKEFLPNIPVASLTEPVLTTENTLLLDLSENNPYLSLNDVADAAALSSWINNQLAKQRKAFAIGGYMEERLIYKRSSHFDNANGESRTIHLGTDIWGPEQMAIYAPCNGYIHSFNDNANFGDYGPTIILAHKFANKQFFTLYGHLSRKSIRGIAPGDLIKAGQKLATLGNSNENGNWPPHLHFQIITDMQGREGDFPGVAAPSQLTMYRELCPDPNLLIRL